ncbi:hypothetical protein BH09VER1_BH09VER1_49180 [soil metagenome]
MKRHLRTWLACVLTLGGAAVLRAADSSTYAQIGYTDLVNELTASGTAVPDGSGVRVTQSEAPVSFTGTGASTVYAYLPDPSLYAGVTITNQSAASYTGTGSWHADLVGQTIYGNSSMGSGVSNVDLYYYADWLQSGKLNYGSTLSAPKTEANDVMNASWVATTGSATNDKNILNRLDYSIQRDDYVAVVGINNHDLGTETQQNLLASAYNVISVGRSDGVHVSGTSTTVNTGVTFPLIVAPVPTTSEATALVSGASVFLISAARSGTGVLHNTSANGDKSEAIKAILLAGATKAQFPSWSNTSTHPLDATYGAGQLNVDNSYHILTAGEQTASASSSNLVANTGWDFNTINLTSVNTISYYLNLTSGGSFSIALTWNALYTPAAGVNYDNMTLSLANLDLYLYTVTSGTVGSLVASSVSTSDNVEYIWSSSLTAGNYVIQVKNATSSGSIDYAVAWQNNGAVPEPGTIALVSLGALALGLSSRRWRKA